MKKKRAGRVTFGGIKVTLERFGVTLDEMREMLGFVAGQIGKLERRMATKDDLFVLQTQINSIESDIHDMKRTRLEVRVADLEEKVFGKAH